jgi:hypothetical protein
MRTRRPTRGEMKRMAEVIDKRQRSDRRRKPRGGRREGDAPGLTPLVVVVDPDPVRRALSLEILARLRFAVAPVDSLVEALAIVPTLTPEVIVVCRADAPRLVAALTAGATVPIVAVDDDTRVTEALVESVRHAIRQASS